jgi:hypothetical protein
MKQKRFLEQKQNQLWRNRIVSYGVKKADQFTANPNNPRQHPQAQRQAVEASLNTLGWIAPVIENARTGYLIDGHERVMQALERNEDVPYILVDLSPEEEAQALLTADYIGSLAGYSATAVSTLLDELTPLELPDDNLRGLLDAIRLDLVEQVDPTAVQGEGSFEHQFAGRVRLVVLIRDLAVVERAIELTGLVNRHEAIAEIFRHYVESRTQAR